MKKVLVIVTKAPYGREDSFGAILLAGTGPAAEMSTKVVFTGDGVHNSVKNQNPTGYFKLGEKELGLPSIEQLIRDFSQVGVEFYALEKDLEARGVEETELVEAVKPITEHKLANLILEANTALVF